MVNEAHMASRPKTYYLQEAIERGFSAIANRLDPEQNMRPYFLLRLQPEPKLEHHIWDLGDMCSRFTDAYLLGRPITGATDYVEEEQALRAMLDTCDPFLNPFMAGRMLLAYVDLYLDSPSEAGEEVIEKLAVAIRSKLQHEEDYSYWFRNAEGWNTLEHAVFGDFNGYPTFPLGGIMLALARYTESVDAPDCEDLLDRMGRFVLGVSGTFDAEGHYQGHTHSGGILTAAVALMRRALRTNDTSTIAKMKTVFDWTLRYSSSWGWIPDGVGPDDASCESCSITDAIHLGLLIARHIDPNYYAILERFARNQLLENQIVHTDPMLPNVDQAQKPQFERALYGSWASWSKPGSLDNCRESVEGCCLGAGIRACYLVWDDIVKKQNDVVSVHMSLSRNSDWVEVISYQPYEGKLELVIHDAPSLRVRVPDWVAFEDITVSIDGAVISVQLQEDGYIRLDGLQTGQLVQLLYPITTVEKVERVSGQDYNVRWRGDTVISVTPSGQIYPLFKREWMNQQAAPLVQGIPYAAQRSGKVHW
ncbi:beta-L-arabinofuranosidase domain-containing protein [Paenibacillus lignilyticus]|uniref:Glycoside hydrolase family 127 protein n=1 Tax=Paenibacillus lignilyticus TaxID=1172615 RepID=A0ABS5CLC4_9BACL|nr:beta-L-arabinofuranosidase domain-containing protein [Paenibacillus lignilyticus]MBP3966626.1 glycoside hydrolase family 127 protein [Paenibacillus lignilyticus]